MSDKVKKLKDMKMMDIKEFQQKGFLQEANRKFFHPLGLNLTIKIDDNGNYSLLGVEDQRDDLEGIYFDFKNAKRYKDNETWNKVVEKYHHVENLRIEKAKVRDENLNFYVEPIEREGEERVS